MDAYAARPGRRRQLKEVGPGLDETPGVPQGDLDEHGREAGRVRVEVSPVRHPAPGTQLDELETVEEPRAVQLVHQEMRKGRQRNPFRARFVCPDPQDGLLTHRPAREERRGRFPEEAGHFLLEQRDRPTVPIGVPPSP